MSHQKRSKTINLSKMRKAFSAKPLALGVASVFLSACGGNDQAVVYRTVDECKTDNPEQAQACELAYQEALEEAQRTGPKYATQAVCENEFGYNQCYQANTNSGSFFMPLMAGYMLGNLMSSGRYYSQPMYTSYSRYSPLRYRWMTADGYDYGDMRRKYVRTNSSTFKPKPAVNRTIKRGGFGSSVRAKSSWGSSKSSKSSWGG